MILLKIMHTKTITIMINKTKTLSHQIIINKYQSKKRFKTKSNKPIFLKCREIIHGILIMIMPKQMIYQTKTNQEKINPKRASIHLLEKISKKPTKTTKTKNCITSQTQIKIKVPTKKISNSNLIQ